MLSSSFYSYATCRLGSGQVLNSATARALWLNVGTAARRRIGL